MSTLESRAHDAERDARTPCPDCAAQGIGSSIADCPGHPAEALPDPDTLDLTLTIRLARFARLAAGTIREDAPAYTTASAHTVDKIAQLFEDYAEHCDTRRDQIVARMEDGGR